MKARPLRRAALVSWLAVATACGGSPTGPAAPSTVTLAVGQSVQAADVGLTFVAVSSDSRCPINALCIQAGDAIAVFRVSRRGLASDYELALVDPARRSVNHRGVMVEFTGLQPQPAAGQPVRVSDYRATLQLTPQ